MPPLRGKPVRVHLHAGLRDGPDEVHAGSFIRERRIAFNCQAREFFRVFVHEVFHFAWVRLGNPRRRRYEALLAEELSGGARGELGWSAEWRKAELTARDRKLRTRRWREYCCESFCDTAACLLAGAAGHEEFTLPGRRRRRRKRWFRENLESGGLSI